MKARTVYFKIPDMKAALSFWSAFLDKAPDKESDQWSEFNLRNIRLGFLLNDFGDEFTGANGAVMFEFTEGEFSSFIERAQNGGARIVSDDRDNPDLRSMTLADPWGNEFECGLEGTHH